LKRGERIGGITPRIQAGVCALLRAGLTLAMESKDGSTDTHQLTLAEARKDHSEFEDLEAILKLGLVGS
jgi:hypothetical protein